MSGASCFKYSDIDRFAPGLGLGKGWQDDAPGSSGLVRALQLALFHDVNLALPGWATDPLSRLEGSPKPPLQAGEF